MNKLKDEVALITGGPAGIGLAAAKLFHAEGAKVFVTGRNQTGIDEARKQLPKDIEVLSSDTASMDNVQAPAWTIKATVGTIERRISVNSIRNMAASLAAAVILAASANTQAQSAPKPYTQQADPGISSIATYQQQAEVMTLMAAYLGLWLAEDPSRYAFEQFVTEDAVFEYPYADDASRRVEGRKAIGQALRKFPVMASNWKFTDLRLFQTLYPDIFFVAYEARAYVPATQRTYESHHLARITVRDGKIADYNELWDRDAKAAAFGTTGQN